MQVGDQDDESKKCTFENCTQIDFLASRCGYCGAMFCVSHTSAEAHKCRAFGTQTAICPVCAFHVPLDRADRLPDDAISRHLDRHCRLRGQTARPRGAGCGVTGCAGGSGVAVRCEDCRGIFCVAHRAPARHECRAARAKAERRVGDEGREPRRKAKGNAERPLCVPRNAPGTALGKIADDPQSGVTLLVALARELNVRPFFMNFSRSVVVGRALDSIVSQATLDSARVAALQGTWALYLFRRTVKSGSRDCPDALTEMRSMETLQSYNIENGSIVFLGKREMMTAEVINDNDAYLKEVKAQCKKSKSKEKCVFL